MATLNENKILCMYESVQLSKESTHRHRFGKYPWASKIMFVGQLNWINRYNKG